MKPHWQLGVGILIGLLIAIIFTGIYQVQSVPLDNTCARLIRFNRITGTTWTSFCAPGKEPEPWRKVDSAPAFIATTWQAPASDTIVK